MLEHQQETLVSDQAAAQQRITPLEMSAALAALESRREEEAKRVAGTVPIGQAVQELGLDVTPEQVWEQVQAQRRSSAAPVAVSPPNVVPPSSLQQETPGIQQTAGNSHRRWKRFVPLLAILAVGGAWFSRAHGISVDGDQQTMTYSGNRGFVMLNGNEDRITLAGNCDTLVVTGDKGTVTVTGYVHHVIIVGDHDTIAWVQENPADPPSVTDWGDENSIERH